LELFALLPNPPLAVPAFPLEVGGEIVEQLVLVDQVGILAGRAQELEPGLGPIVEDIDCDIPEPDDQAGVGSKLLRSDQKANLDAIGKIKPRDRLTGALERNLQLAGCRVPGGGVDGCFEV